MRIMTLDPGGTTGYCIANGMRISDVGQLSGDHHRTLYATIKHYDPELIIYERFVHRSTYGVDQSALEFIGVVKLYHQQHPGVDIQPQTSAQAKTFWTDAKIKKIGLWKPNQRHAMDAVRHALVYIMNHDDYYIRKLASTP